MELWGVQEPEHGGANNLTWKTVLGIFVWHAVYGLHLGALYNPLPEAETSRVELASAPR